MGGPYRERGLPTARHTGHRDDRRARAARWEQGLDDRGERLFVADEVLNGVGQLMRHRPTGLGSGRPGRRFRRGAPGGSFGQAFPRQYPLVHADQFGLGIDAVLLGQPRRIRSKTASASCCRPVSCRACISRRCARCRSGCAAASTMRSGTANEARPSASRMSQRSSLRTVDSSVSRARWRAAKSPGTRLSGSPYQRPSATFSRVSASSRCPRVRASAAEAESPSTSSTSVRGPVSVSR